MSEPGSHIDRSIIAGNKMAYDGATQSSEQLRNPILNHEDRGYFSANEYCECYSRIVMSPADMSSCVHHYHQCGADGNRSQHAPRSDGTSDSKYQENVPMNSTMSFFMEKNFGWLQNKKFPFLIRKNCRERY